MEQEVKHPLRLSQEALQMLLTINDNSNNVREVENVIRRSAVFAACQGHSIEQHHVQRALQGSSAVEFSPAQSASAIMTPLVGMHGLGGAMELVKREVVRDALRRNCGNICQTADALKLDRHTLQRLLKSWDMEK
jgi:DNA-binding NtrC family response regulator